MVHQGLSPLDTDIPEDLLGIHKREIDILQLPSHLVDAGGINPPDEIRESPHVLQVASETRGVVGLSSV
jgi:hypothetical protein